MAYASIARTFWGNSASASSTSPVASSSPVASVGASSPAVYAGLQDGMTQQDNGDGTYGILYNGQSLGTGYKDVRSAISEIGYNNASKSSYEKDGKFYSPYFSMARNAWRDESGQEVTQFDNGEGGTLRPDDIFSNSSIGPQEYNGKQYSYQTIAEDTAYNSQDELNNALRGYTHYTNNGGGIIGDWETLGQVLSGAVKPEVKGEGYMTNSGVAEEIKGTNTLYGSTPVFGKNEDGSYGLLGYRTDLSPGEKYDGGDTQWTDMGVSAKHNGDKSAWGSSVWRELNNPEEWGKAAVVGTDGNTFIPKEAVDSLPGWKNKDSYSFKKTESNTGLKFVEIVGNVVGMLYTGYPVGSALVGAYNLSEGDEKAAKGNLINAAATYAAGQASSGAPVETGISSTGVAANSMLSSAVTDAATQAAVGGAAAGLGTYAMTGDASTAFKATLGGAVTGALSGYFSGSGTTLKDLTGFSSGNAALDRILMKAGMGAAKSAISAGAQGADVGDAFSRAGISAMSTLVGGTVGVATDSGLAGSIASTATSGALNAAIKKNGQDDDTETSSPSTTTTPTTTPTATTASPKTYAAISRTYWR